MKSLAVLVPAYQEEARVAAHVASIWQDLPGLAPMRVTVKVLANGCVDRTAEVAQMAIDSLPSYDHVSASVITLREPSKTAAINFGLQTTDSEVIAVTDSDTELGPGCLAAALETLAGTNAVLVGANLVPKIPEYLAGTAVGHLMQVREICASVAGRYPYPVGAFMVYYRRILDRIGMYDEKIVSCEDTRMVLRVMHHYGDSAVVVCPDAFVYSTPPFTIGDMITQGARHNQAQAKMLAAEPQLLAACRRRSLVLQALSEAADAGRRDIMDQMMRAGIPADALDLFLTILPKVQQFTAQHEVLTRPNGRWQPVPRLVSI